MPSLLLVHSGSDLYGSDLACLEIAQGAIERGWRVEVLLPRLGPLSASLANLEIPTHIVDPLVVRRRDLSRHGATLPLRAVRDYARLRALARRTEYDVVHANTLPMFGGLLLARRHRAPLVWSVHEFLGAPPALMRAVERVLGRADQVVTCSKSVAAQFPRLGSQCQVVYTGADVPADVPMRVPFTDESVTLCCVARLNAWKGQDVLVQAARNLHDWGHPVHVQLIGDVFADRDVYRQRLQSLVSELSLTQYVHFEGELPRVIALRRVGSADIFVLPSRLPEPFGMALVEAMALRRPVVATAAGGPVEIVTERVNGLLVKPGDSVGLASAVRVLIESPQRAIEMGEAAADRAQQFRMADMVSAVFEIYQRVLSQR